MSNKAKGLIAILVIIIISIIVFLCGTYAKEFIGSTNNNTIQAMNETTNIVENTVEEVQNTVEENTITEPEPVDEPEEEVVEEEPVQEDNSELQEDNEEERALAIVKKDWGDTEGVAFKVEQINGDGSYVISVRNDNSVALEWYTVYPKTGKFTK